MVEIFIQLAYKWPKMRTNFAPIFQTLKIFAGICAPIVAPRSDDFQICSLRWSISSTKKAVQLNTI